MEDPLVALNHFIETKKQDRLLDEYFKTVTFPDLRTISTNELIASFVALLSVERTPVAQAHSSTFHIFRQMFQHGKNDVVFLTEEEKRFLITCLSDPRCKNNMMKSAERCREELCTIRKLLPTAMKILQNRTLYSQEKVEAAQNITRRFVKCNQRAINYQQYLDCAEQVFHESSHS